MDGEECMFPFSFPLSLADIGGFRNDEWKNWISHEGGISLVTDTPKERENEEEGHSGVGYVGLEEKGGGGLHTTIPFNHDD